MTESPNVFVRALRIAVLLLLGAVCYHAGYNSGFEDSKWDFPGGNLASARSIHIGEPEPDYGPGFIAPTVVVESYDVEPADPAPTTAKAPLLASAPAYERSSSPASDDLESGW